MKRNARFVFGPLKFLVVKYFYANIGRRKTTFGKTNIYNYNEHEQQQLTFFFFFRVKRKIHTRVPQKYFLSQSKKTLFDTINFLSFNTFSSLTLRTFRM